MHQRNNSGPHFSRFTNKNHAPKGILCKIHDVIQRDAPRDINRSEFLFKRGLFMCFSFIIRWNRELKECTRRS